MGAVKMRKEEREWKMVVAVKMREAENADLER
jgi:hypothetical protein